METLIVAGLLTIIGTAVLAARRRDLGDLAVVGRRAPMGAASPEGPAAGFPKILTTVVLLGFIVPIGCAWEFAPRPPPPSMGIVRVIEVPVRTVSDRADLLALFRDEAAKSGMVFVDATESWRNAPPSVRKTLYIALDRPVGRRRAWEITAEDEGPGSAPWVTFFRGVDPGKAAVVRDQLVAALKARFFEVVEVPVLDGSSLPLRHDLVRAGSTYEIRPDRAASYKTSP